jgi:16S rRNA (guanine527-N7)-methyltransferase
MPDHDGYGPEDIARTCGVSRETLSRIETVVETLGDWRTRMNLIGPAEWSRVWRRHVLDSVQLFPLLPDGPILDLGSGAGFPGLIIAAERAGDAAPQPVILVESVTKKCAFLRAAADAADLSASVLNQRVESVRDVDVAAVTARAFAPLPKLLGYAAPWLEAGATGIFPKGKRWKEELTEAQKVWTFAHEVIPSLTSDEGVLLEITEVSSVR